MRADTAQFGTWADPTSRTMYHDLMPGLLSGLDLTGEAVDLGGGNGLLREWVPQATTVDINPTMAPDIVADVLTWVPDYRPAFAVTRYTAHYWSAVEFDRFLWTVARYTDRLVSIQIDTLDWTAKQRVSHRSGEVAYWRTAEELARFYHDAGWEPVAVNWARYRVLPSFYRHRLNLDPADLLAAVPAEGHDEAVIVHDLRRA